MWLASRYWPVSTAGMLAVIAPVAAPLATSVLLFFFFLVKSDGLQPEKSNSSETQNGFLVFEHMLTIYYCKHDFRPSGFVYMCMLWGGGGFGVLGVYAMHCKIF